MQPTLDLIFEAVFEPQDDLWLRVAAEADLDATFEIARHTRAEP